MWLEPSASARGPANSTEGVTTCDCSKRGVDGCPEEEGGVAKGFEKGFIAGVKGCTAACTRLPSLPGLGSVGSEENEVNTPGPRLAEDGGKAGAAEIAFAVAGRVVGENVNGGGAGRAPGGNAAGGGACHTIGV